jgi:hypothetical protein
MDKEMIFLMIGVVLLNIAGFFIGYMYGHEPVIKVNDNCLIYEEILYCEPEQKLQINFG